MGQRPFDMTAGTVSSPRRSADPPYPDEHLVRIGLDRARLPRHVAIIMDGNGRWAAQRRWERIVGHRHGVQSVRAVIEECSRLGLEQLTLYCFSSENWKRPEAEQHLLMQLLKQYLIEERAEIVRQNLQFAMIGRRAGLSAEVLEEVDRSYAAAAENTGMRLCLAVNYGSRGELVDAIRKLAEAARAGTLDPAAIDEQTVADSLYTAGMPDPDLVIRTAGEMRVSNYLLWQISYAELWVTDTLWPDFSTETLHQALRDYAARDRRFGGLKG